MNERMNRDSLHSKGVAVEVIDVAGCSGVLSYFKKMLIIVSRPHKSKCHNNNGFITVVIY